MKEEEIKNYEKLVLSLLKKKGRGDRRIIVSEQTLWSKTEIAVLAYFNSVKNKPSTYMEIARAYVSSSYTNYKKACEDLLARGYLEKEGNKFKPRSSALSLIKKGTETVERSLPFFERSLKQLKQRKKS